MSSRRCSGFPTDRRHSSDARAGSTGPPRSSWATSSVASRPSGPTSTRTAIPWVQSAAIGSGVGSALRTDAMTNAVRSRASWLIRTAEASSSSWASSTAISSGRRSLLLRSAPLMAMNRSLVSPSSSPSATAEKTKSGMVDIARLAWSRTTSNPCPRARSQAVWRIVDLPVPVVPLSTAPTRSGRRRASPIASSSAVRPRTGAPPARGGPTLREPGIVDGPGRVPGAVHRSHRSTRHQEMTGNPTLTVTVACDELVGPCSQ